ncbi:SPOR domain-containing protein [Stagnihabitans tardus]|uniref:SPOR domain-containing protein n=1 Tax=Stagnihabitans tardus TaxID=2699202 RepID=A0AAE4Y976_9RHOB|nr:SPOR domain-containing protein [Stagnihabitans tardus]NBZ88348.1 hypothetical protein [Stagnihabitans tardus]
MRVRIWGPALAGAVLMALAGTAGAQSLRQVTAPANPPPAGFKGQQFIDSRGCVFVRAGFDGRVNWVPRIDGSRRPICGMQPTGSARPPQVAEELPAAAPVVVAEAPAPQAPTTQAQPRTPGKGLFAFLFAPAAPRAPAPVAQPVALPVVTQAAPEVTVTFTEPVRRTLPKPPKGWAYAWKDDRLNPMRGVGTPAGQAAQDRLYTQEVPMVLIADLPAKEQPKAQPRAQASRVTLATMSAPEAAQGGILVQVGCFGDPSNAERAAGKIAGLGLPVSTGSQKGLKVVMAGPFASAAEAQAGLSALRAAGFADAFVR